MPIYEYECGRCHHRFETLVMHRDETVHCPDCRGTNLKKLMSAHAVGHGQAEPACAMPACGAGACPACQ